MRSYRLPAVICAALLPLNCLAVPITYEFSGVIDQAGGRAPPEGQVFESIIPFFTEFSASITYDNETPVERQNANSSRYLHAITAATISFGPEGSLGVFEFDNRPIRPEFGYSSSIVFLNDAVGSRGEVFDQFFMTASLGNRPGDPANMYRTLGFTMIDLNAQQISAGQSLLDPLPLMSPSLGFRSISFGYNLIDDAGQDIDQSGVSTQNITIRQVTSVPEPGTWSLLAAGLFGIGFARRRRPHLMCEAR